MGSSSKNVVDVKILFKQHRFHSNVFEWFSAFQELGHEVNLVLYKEDNTYVKGLNQAVYLPPSKFSNRWRKKNPRTRGDGIDRFSPYYFPSFKTLISFLKTEKPKLVVLRPAFTLFSYMFLLLKPFFGYKVLFYSQVRIAKPVVWYKKAAMELLLFLFSAHWMSPCPGEADKHAPISKRMIYFPFTISEKLKQRTNYFTDEFVNILVVAKMYPSKNILLVLKMMNDLRMQFKSLRLTIVSGGEVHQSYHQKVLHFIEQHDLTGHVKLHYRMSIEQMKQFYLNHDIFILPSDYDQAAYVMVESMAYGLVTIASNGNGTSDYLTHGVDGYLFEKNNLQKLEKIVNHLILNKQLIPQIGNEAIKTIKNQHDPIIRAEQLLRRINLS